MGSSTSVAATPTSAAEPLCAAEDGFKAKNNKSDYWTERIPWYPHGCFGPYRVEEGYSRRELVADGVVHVIGVLSGLLAVGMLISNVYGDRSHRQLAVSVAVYGCSLLVMLCCSAIFNGFAWTRHIRELQLADHAGILFLIAGTYTPVMTLACAPYTLAFVWFVLVVSFTAKATNSRFDVVALHVPCFLMMGWCVVFVWNEVMSKFTSWAISMAVLGGMFYTVGLIPWASNCIEFHNAIWHVFVLAGSACFYMIVYIEVSQPANWQEEPPGTCQGYLFTE